MRQGAKAFDDKGFGAVRFLDVTLAAIKAANLRSVSYNVIQIAGCSSGWVP
jgi:hypothetical protein